MSRRQDGPHDRLAAPELSVVVPLYNEQENLAELHERLGQVLDELGLSCEILLVDDGSHDATPELLAELPRHDSRIAVLTLSRNFGHQAAISAGLDHARGQAVVILDGDLQDPPELITDLVARWREGFEVVYAVRRRRVESWPRRLAYHLFYRLLRQASELDIPLDSGDFGLLDRRVVDALASLPERARFVRGLRSFVGFRQTALPYDRPARAAGTPKYTLRRLLTLAIDGLVSFSGRPLRLVTGLGLASALLALGLIAWVLLDALHNHTAPRGWASILAAVLFMGAVQLVSLGILGEYVRLIFIESKGRPSYIVRDYRSGRGQQRSRRRASQRPIQNPLHGR